MPRKTIGTSSNVSSDAADSTPRWEKHNKPIDNGSLNSKPEPENDVQQKSFQTKPLTGNSNRTALRPVSRIQYVGNVHSERRSTMNINGPVDFSGWKSSNK